MVRFDIDRFPPSVTPGIGTDGFSAGVPVGIGVSLKLTNHLAFELNGRYTYALSDELNGTVLKKGNDGFLSFMAGLTLDSFGGKPAGAKPLEVKKWVPPSIEDTDGDGLKDADEISRYQTDPSKADTDGDDLSDDDEVVVLMTDPTRADTDGGSVSDGNEIARGTDPLDAADDVPQIVLETVYFATDAAVFTPQTLSILDNLGAMLAANPLIELEIRGYSDNVGTDNLGHSQAVKGSEYHLMVSQKRAESVKTYLVDKGIAEYRLTVEAFGEDHPAASNLTPEDRLKNRRVEFVRTK